LPRAHGKLDENDSEISGEDGVDEILEEVGITKRIQFYKDMEKFLTWIS